MNCDAAVPGARGTLGKQQTLSFCTCFASVSNDLLFSVQRMRYTLEFCTFKALPIITIKALARLMMFQKKYACMMHGLHFLLSVLKNCGGLSTKYQP